MEQVLKALSLHFQEKAQLGIIVDVLAVLFNGLDQMAHLKHGTGGLLPLQAGRSCRVPYNRKKHEGTFLRRRARKRCRGSSSIMRRNSALFRTASTSPMACRQFAVQAGVAGVQGAEPFELMLHKREHPVEKVLIDLFNVLHAPFLSHFPAIHHQEYQTPGCPSSWSPAGGLSHNYTAGKKEKWGHLGPLQDRTEDLVMELLA